MARARFPHPLYDKLVLRPFYDHSGSLFFGPMLAANRAHAIMLQRCGIIARENAGALLRALDEVERVGADGLTREAGVEDLFFAMENKLIELAGAAQGGNLQLARSRNDLGYALTRLALRPPLLAVIDDLLDLRESLGQFASRHTDTLMPGYTHTQPAQPTTMAHYIAGVLAGLERDTARLRAAHATNNQSPLGAAALTGTAFPIDRELSARLLGFDGIQHSTYDSIGASDNMTEAAGALATLAVNLSRFTHDLLFMATQESGAIVIDASFIQISSIMPQKRNPVVLEHLRARLSRMLALAQGIFTQCHNIPFGDTQDIEDEIIPPLFGSLETAREILQLYGGVIDTLEVNVAHLGERAGAAFTTVTELADCLVSECDLSFRQAHHIVSALVGYAQERQLDSADLSVDMLRQAAAAAEGVDLSLSGEIFARALDPRAFVESHVVTGGAAPSATAAILRMQGQSIQGDRRWLRETRDSLAAAEEELQSSASDLLAG